jgi:hypothetical protein
MFGWIARFGIHGQIKTKIDEAILIFQHVVRVLLKEPAAVLHIYGDVMFKVVSDEAEKRKVSPTEIILGGNISWRDLAAEDKETDDVVLLKFAVMKHDLPKERIYFNVKKSCEAIIKISRQLTVDKERYPSIYSSEMKKCCELYVGLVSKLYLLGSGESTFEETRVRLSSSF